MCILIILLSVTYIFGMEYENFIEVKNNECIMIFFKMPQNLCIDTFVENNQGNFEKHNLLKFPLQTTFSKNISFGPIEFNKDVTLFPSDSMKDLYIKLRDAFKTPVSVTFNERSK